MNEFPMSASEQRIAARQDAAEVVRCEFCHISDAKPHVVDAGSHYEVIVLCDECLAERQS